MKGQWAGFLTGWPALSDSSLQKQFVSRGLNGMKRQHESVLARRPHVEKPLQEGHGMLMKTRVADGVVGVSSPVCSVAAEVAWPHRA